MYIHKLTHEDSKRLHMEVPIRLQQITSSTLMSSAVAYLCHFKYSRSISLGKLYMFILLALGLGILQMPDVKLRNRETL